MYIISIIIVLMLVLVSCLPTSANVDTAALPSELTTVLDSGPIKVEKTNVQCKISRQHALEIAYIAVAGESPPTGADAWPSVFSDSEFIGNPINKRRCWIVLIHNVILNNSEGQKDLFAVVDGDFGNFIEVFSLPENSWWKTTDKVGPFLQNLYSMNGQIGLISNDVPIVSFKQAYASLNTGFLKNDLSQKKQIVARYLLYTDNTISFNISRVDGYKYIPVSRNAPTWYICLQGLNRLAEGPLPPGIDPSKLQRVQEDFIKFDVYSNKITEFGNIR